MKSLTRLTRAKALLIAEGLSYTTAAQSYGKRSAIAQLVERFTRESLAALTPKHGGSARTQYIVEQQQQILTVVQAQPELEPDGVSQWSLVTVTVGKTVAVGARQGVRCAVAKVES